MDSRLISKLDKARRYADEPERVTVHDFAVTFRGDHATHEISSHAGKSHCTCAEFSRTGDCAHVVAVRYMFARAFDGKHVDHEAHLLAVM